MSKENGYSMQAVPAFSNLNNCPIFSMTSTQTQVGTVGDESCNILVIGDQSGNISLWSIHNDAIFGCGPAPKDSFSRVGVVKGGQGKHSITTTKIIQKNILVSGNTNGDIRFWDIESVQKPRLSLRQDHCGAHSGSVEACMSVGDVLLTSGGNDGKLVGWDISTCNEIGGLSCHPGRKTLVRDTRSRRTMKCCVIGFILPAKREGRLVTLCRDGVLAYWAFDVP
jgi:WD40 repeat protein